MSRLPIAPDTLRVLFHDNSTDLSFGGTDEFTQWRQRLPFEHREFWQELPWKQPQAAGAQRPPYSFHYERERFSPFHIDRNFSAAVQLLEECYALRDAATELEVKILEQEAAFKMADALAALEGEEDATLLERMQTIGSARSLTAAMNGGETQVHGTIAPGAAERELALAQARRAVANENRKRLKEEAANPLSPYHQHLRHGRLIAKYNLRLAELVMYVDALKHGLLHVYGIRPIQLEMSREDIERAFREFQNYPEDLRRAIDAATGQDRKPPVEPEHHIRRILWEAGKKLQALALHTDDFVDAFSLVSCVPKDEWTRDIAKGFLTFRLPADRYSGLQRARMLGVSAQVILSDDRHSHEVGKGFAVEFKSERFQGQPVRFDIGVPLQPMASTGEKWAGRKIACASPASVLRHSNMLNGSAPPVLYGRSLVENFDPLAGSWSLSFSPIVDATLIKDILLFVHVRHVPYLAVNP